MCVVLSLAGKVSASGPPLRAQVATKADFAPLPHVIPGYNQHPLQQQRLWPRTANFSAIRRHRVMPCLPSLSFCLFLLHLFPFSRIFSFALFSFPFSGCALSPNRPGGFWGFFFRQLAIALSSPTVRFGINSSLN